MAGRDLNAKKLIDLLQAPEKITAVKDEGDGSAFKVDGVRGSKKVGMAGDFSGTREVITEQRKLETRLKLSGREELMADSGGSGSY